MYRNDALTVAEALALEPAAIVISPGPRTPGEAGISVPLVAQRRVEYRCSAYAWAIRP